MKMGHPLSGEVMNEPCPWIRRVVFPFAPIGKPRQTQSDKWKKRPVVVAWRAFADAMRATADRSDFRMPDQGARIAFVLPMPASWSARKKALMRGEPHRQKPDVDNMAKAVLDALCEDDCTVWQLAGLEKRWGDKGSITIEVAA